MQKMDLVFLPGLLSDSQAWQHQINTLQATYNTHVISLTDFSTPDEMVDHVLKQAPEEFILFGHSLGGWVALETVKKAPLRVKGLGILNTTARPESVEMKVTHEKLIKLAQNGEFPAVVNSLLSMFLTPMGLCHSQLHDELQNMFLRIGKDAFIRQQTAVMSRPDCLQDLSSIKCPTFILHACSDVIMNNETQEEMLSRIPNAHMELVRECGHFSLMEKPQEVTKMIEHWLGNAFRAMGQTEESLMA